MNYFGSRDENTLWIAQLEIIAAPTKTFRNFLSYVFNFFLIKPKSSIDKHRLLFYDNLDIIQNVTLIRILVQILRTVCVLNSN